jgi:hypothetical protein
MTEPAPTSARDVIRRRLSEDGMGGIATLQDVDDATALLDAFRAEVLAEAAATVDELERSVRACKPGRREPLLSDGCSIGLQGAAELLRRMAADLPTTTSKETRS